MDRYDYVVVGGGSAGAVLAARLSEDPAVSVLLLEAGPDHDSAGTPAGVRSGNFFRSFEEPGRMWPRLLATRAAGQEASLYVRGRGIGGCSAVNALGALRGTPDDYDRWARDFGCAGWGWPEMLAAFLVAEDDVDHGGDGLHGGGGPIPLARTPVDRLSPFSVAVRNVLSEAGHPTCDDFHAPDATGLSRWALTVRDGRRISTNDAYLEPARQRPNLHIRGDQLVDRVLLDGRRASGVLTAAGGTIEAREIIVSAGAIHSPAILLRSGLGANLPIGANLKEHAMTPGFEVALQPHARKSSVDSPVMACLLRYTSELAVGGPNDMQLVWFDNVGPGEDGLAGARLLGAVMRPLSSGTVRLRSADPHVDPIVDFNLLGDERDLVRLRDAVRRVIDVVHHPTIAAISEGVVALNTPVDELDSDAAIDAWLLANVTDYVHAAGTCRMGAVGDPQAVVDTDCRVIGIDGLRVCDASIMPDIPAANTHLTTVALAERLIRRLRG